MLYLNKIDILRKIFSRLCIWDWLDIFSFSSLAFIANFLYGVPVALLFFCFFALVHFRWRFNSRWPYLLAVFCLVFSSVFLKLFEKNIVFLGELRSNQLSIGAFYFMVVGSVTQILELKSLKPLTKFKAKQKIKKQEKVIGRFSNK